MTTADPSLGKLREPREGDLPWKFLQPSFLESYRAAISQHGDLPFLSWYGLRNKGRSVTFAEFHRDVCLAGAEIERHSREAEIVLTVGGNTYENVVHLIAALTLGRTICPVNPEDGPRRIREKCEKLGSALALWIDPEFPDLLRELGGRALSLSPAAAPGEEPGFRRFEPGQPMVLVFTSGSTGYSKVVEQMEVGILTNIDALIERHRLGPEECIATPLPIFHVNALEFSLFSALLSGTRLVLFERPILPLLLKGLQNERCGILSIVPPILKMLVEGDAEWARFDLSRLKYIVTAAAPLSVELVRAAEARLNVRVAQGYGLSEAVNFSCQMPPDLHEEEHRRWSTEFAYPSIGTCLRGTQVFIVDEAGQPLGEGVVGEVCVRGATVMRGYREDPDRAVFRGDFLHTGDLGFFHADRNGNNYYFISGRIKETIKRYGMTISLREIDDILAGFPEPGFDAISIGFPNDWSGEEVGVVVSQSPAWNDEAGPRLAEYLERQLPPHLRPKAICLTRRPIRTASGKPCRWPFAGQFERYRMATIGQGVRFQTDSAVPRPEPGEGGH